MKRVVCLLGVAALLALVPVLVDRAEAVGPPEAVHVNGGGTGLFIEPSVTPTDLGLTTNFAIGATIYSDGSAKGHFTCLVPSIVVIAGDYTAGSYNAMTGVATASGFATILFPTGDEIEVEFTTTFTEGGPGVGVFTLSETSGYFPNYPDDVDTEVVLKGRIRIH